MGVPPARQGGCAWYLRGGVGVCYNNAMIKSLSSRMQGELLDQLAADGNPTTGQAITFVGPEVVWFERLHTSVG
jgi:hypothetical protein